MTRETVLRRFIVWLGFYYARNLMKISSPGVVRFRPALELRDVGVKPRVRRGWTRPKTVGKMLIVRTFFYSG